MPLEDFPRDKGRNSTLANIEGNSEKKAVGSVGFSEAH